MKFNCLPTLALAFSFVSWLPATAQSPAATCPTNAVFLALQDQVRGYPTRANGPTAPCQILQGSSTGFSTVNSLAISRHGNLHVSQFLTNGEVSVFEPDAQGDVAPERIESTYTNDLLGVATDSMIEDFVLSRRSSPSTIVVVLPSTTTPAYSFDDPALAKSGGIAIDADDNLLIAGYDLNANVSIDTFATSVSLSNPPLIRRIAGPDTGLLAGELSDFLQNTVVVTTDPENEEIYVYNYSPSTGSRQISVFPPEANGNVKPVRVIAGGATQLGVPGTLVNKIAVSADGRLFVAEANNRILVFAPGAGGDVPPAQIIEDSTIGTSQIAQGGIAVRSCTCQ